MRARARGAAVILITNAPRPSAAVARQLEKLHVPRETYDAIVSSGDVTRGVIEQRAGQSLFHLGPERDRSIFTGLDVRFAPLESADYVVCSGLDDDEVETPDDYRARLEIMLERKLFMVCGNPDVVVERGPGWSIAPARSPISTPPWAARCSMPASPTGRSTTWRWPRRKPRPAARWRSSRVLAIGDSVRTDLEGRARLRRRFPVRDLRHPCRGTGRPRAARRRRAERGVCRRRRNAEGGDARVGMVRSGRGRRGHRRLGLGAEHGVDLALERLRVERLDDVVRHAGAFLAAITFSVLDSAVTMMNGVCARLGSLRTSCSRS